MKEPVRTFGECLEELMRDKGISAQRLAEMTGYKSKTSIARILRDESIHTGRERLLRILEAQKLLRPEEQRALRQALEVNRIGRETAQARMMLYDVLTCKQRAQALGQEAARAMESLRVARSARVLVLNCCWPGVMRTLREILEARPAHGIEHFMVIGDTKPEMMSALCALLRSAYLPGYACYAWREGSGAADGFAKVNALCFTAQDRDGACRDTLLFFSGEDAGAAYTLPAERGLFEFFERAIERHRFAPVVSAYKPLTGPQGMVSSIRFCTELERGHDISAVKPDLCINAVEPLFLRAALLEGGVLEGFAGWDEKRVRVLLEEFLYFQGRRFEAEFSGTHIRRQIMSPKVMRVFALTGKFSAPFPAIRPFTVGERIAILENFVNSARRDENFSLWLWRDEEIAMEVTCFHDLGVFASPAGTSGALDIDIQASLIRHPRLLALFRECFEDDLLRNHVMSREESLAYLANIADGLRQAP